MRIVSRPFGFMDIPITVLTINCLRRRSFVIRLETHATSITHMGKDNCHPPNLPDLLREFLANPSEQSWSTLPIALLWCDCGPWLRHHPNAWGVRNIICNGGNLDRMSETHGEHMVACPLRHLLVPRQKAVAVTCSRKEMALQPLAVRVQFVIELLAIIGADDA